MANKPVALAFQTKFHFLGIKAGKFPSIKMVLLRAGRNASNYCPPMQPGYSGSVCRSRGKCSFSSFVTKLSVLMSFFEMKS
jgi:hypothetical protein